MGITLESLTKRLAEVVRKRSAETQALAAASGLYAGVETRTDPEAYRWEGRRRAGSRRTPFVLFQYTLGGKGIFKDATGTHPVTPGRAFVCIVPSDHVYYLPVGETWTFFWNICHHPYVVQRLAAAVGGVGRTLTAGPTAPVVLAALDLFDGTCRGGFDDRFGREAALFRFMLELERHIHERSVSVSERDQLLSDVRRHVLEHVGRRVDVTEVAERYGMSRSHFSHHFRNTTGRPPADYITEVRLGEAARLLTTSDVTLKELASRCGFADANHLCKAFRRRYHISPGAYRTQQ